MIFSHALLLLLLCLLDSFPLVLVAICTRSAGNRLLGPKHLPNLPNLPSQEDLGPSGATRSRLGYDELLASQLVLSLRRRQTRGAERTTHENGVDDSSAAAAADAVVAAPEENGSRDVSGTALLDEGRRRLPFELTSSQNKGTGTGGGTEGRGERV